MVLYTIAEIIFALTVWICKRTVIAGYEYWWPPAEPSTTNNNDLAQVKQILEEIRDLERQRLELAQQGKDTRHIEELANSLLEESCANIRVLE